LGFTGSVTMSCSGLPAGAACSFQPQPAVLDGFDTTAVALTITESSSHAFLHVTPYPSEPLTPITAASVLLLILLRERRLRRACAHVVLLCALGMVLGCGSGSSFSSTPTVVTITVAGGSGSAAVSHSVQIAVTFN